MFVRPPLCGCTLQHDSHWDNVYNRSCSGWTDDQENVQKLCELVVLWSRLAQMEPRKNDEPRKLKLWVHPHVFMILRTHIVPDYSMGPDQIVPLPPEVEVEADSSLPAGSWRFEIARGSF